MEINPTGFGTAAKDYGEHRAGFPPSLFERLQRFGVGLDGQRLIDLGTGTGTLARGFASQGCEVVGIDPDDRMLATAAELALEAGDNITWLARNAEDTALPSNSAEVVTAGQCWHWFDRPAAAREVHRLLKPAGMLVICYLDWLPLPASVVAATEALIEQHNPQWHMGGRDGFWNQWLPDLQAEGFQHLETFSYDLDVPYSHEGWCGRIRASAGVTALEADQAARFEAEHRALLAQSFLREPLAVPHRIFAIIAKAPEESKETR